ncbi:MAG TPA: SMI1/KNR4 family protein [Chthoniobacter sp.]|nr:SMI1/KNR4 family protein [Chthoniobacter sp.]
MRKTAKQKSPKLRGMEICGADGSLDATSNWKPLNPLSVRCAKCSFPDYDRVTEPYLLRRAAINTAGDFAVGHDYRLLVKERLRKVIELVAPDCCRFYPTYAQGTNEPTPWFLGVALHLSAPGIKAYKKPLRLCAACGEPFARNKHLIAEYTDEPLSIYDIAAPLEWQSWGRPEGEIFRFPIISVRLLALLQQLRFRGICTPPALNETEKEWVARNLDAVRAAGLGTGEPAAKASAAERKWFVQWLKGRRKKTAKGGRTLQELEWQHGVTLPPEYHDFAAASGEVVFDDVEDSGLEVRLLPPAKVDFSHWRKGATKMTDADSRKVDGVMIAETNCGDVFCFDLAGRKAQPPVLRYDHEMDCYEEYADHFVAALRRFANAVQ